MKPSTMTKLDEVFSEYIRLRDASESGLVRCISCPSTVNWKYVDNGHFVKRDNMATRYHEKNCNGQCKVCNQGMDGNIEGYELGLIKKYGPMVIEELNEERRRTVKISESEAQEMLKKYRRLVIDLKKQKAA